MKRCCLQKFRQTETALQEEKFLNVFLLLLLFASFGEMRKSAKNLFGNVSVRPAKLCAINETTSTANFGHGTRDSYPRKKRALTKNPNQNCV